MNEELSSELIVNYCKEVQGVMAKLKRLVHAGYLETALQYIGYIFFVGLSLKRRMTKQQKLQSFG